MGIGLGLEDSQKRYGRGSLCLIQSLVVAFVSLMQMLWAKLTPYVVQSRNGPQMLVDCEKEPQRYHDDVSQDSLGSYLRRREAADAAFEAQVLALLAPVKTRLAELTRDSGRSGPVTRHSVAPHDLETSPDLPPPPEIFYGREQELSALVRTFSQERQAHSALLGPEGAGKSALALALLHSPEIGRKFAARRFLVRCDAAEGATGVLLRLASTLGLSHIPRPAMRDALLSALRCCPYDSLIVLDDLDVWAEPRTRLALEDLLADLAAIPSVSLLLTLRGSQRPLGPAYTRPHPAPLGPLLLPAARALFRAISDLPPLPDLPTAPLPHEEPPVGDPEQRLEDAYGPAVDALLHYAGCVPRTVVLLAQRAQYEPLPFLLARCAEEGAGP
ncbi:hypothetical protein DFH07DRAFT_786851 [Mycena maculata]|uniref:AAA+ ATPase domain-containing protein n=1 Tax=Mycena maculata TaxID=230809 RepID=A0AAD7KI63_9AGAR|nr:hypothetical protein DFH07DRAFT_786851 [Mycena maculata]